MIIKNNKYQINKHVIKNNLFVYSINQILSKNFETLKYKTLNISIFLIFCKKNFTNHIIINIIQLNKDCSHKKKIQNVHIIL